LWGWESGLLTTCNRVLDHSQRRRLKAAETESYFNPFGGRLSNFFLESGTLSSQVYVKPEIPLDDSGPFLVGLDRHQIHPLFVGDGGSVLEEWFGVGAYRVAQLPESRLTNDPLTHMTGKRRRLLNPPSALAY